MPAKAGDHLVEHEDRAVLAAERLKRFEEARSGLLASCRLEKDGSDPAGMSDEKRAEALSVVVLKAHRLGASVRGDSPVHRRRADEPVVVRKEGVLGANGDQVPSRVRTSQLEGRGGRGRPVLRPLDHLGAVDDLEKALGAFELDDGRPREVGAEGKRLPHRLDHGRIRVAERDGAKSHAVLDEFVAVDVPDVAPTSRGR